MAATTLTNRALIRLSGEGVRGFLQGLVTNDVGMLVPERPLWAGLLSPQGKALFDFILWAYGDEDVLVDCERAAAGDVARRLTLYRLRRKIEIAREAELCVHWRAAGEDGVPDPRLPDLGRRWLAPASDAAADAEWLRHRLSLGVTEGLAELGSDKILWLECNARELNGVSFTKGCFVGQENTARMHYRSKVNRRLVVVRTTQARDRTRIFYPELGLAVEHRLVDALGDVLIPHWLAAALEDAPAA